MKLKSKYSLLLSMTAIALMALTGLLGCNTAGCLENRNAVPLAGFYGSDSVAVALDSIEITGVGAPNGTPLSPATKTKKEIYLPMRSTENITQWVFSYKYEYLDFPELNDTLTLEYESQACFVSDECGVIYKYLITRLECTHNLFEGVGIVDSLVTNVDKEYLKIYFRTRPADEDWDDEELPEDEEE